MAIRLAILPRSRCRFNNVGDRPIRRVQVLRISLPGGFFLVERGDEAADDVVLSVGDEAVVLLVQGLDDGAMGRFFSSSRRNASRTFLNSPSSTFGPVETRDLQLMLREKNPDVLHEPLEAPAVMFPVALMSRRFIDGANLVNEDVETSFNPPSRGR